MKKLTLHFVLLCLAHTAAAELELSDKWKCTKADCYRILERWECTERSTPDWKNILVTANVLEHKKHDAHPVKFGHISVANINYTSAYYVEGFIRTWRFKENEDKSSYLYAFTIEPNGDGSYYEFQGKGSAAPSLYMKCRQKK